MGGYTVFLASGVTMENEQGTATVARKKPGDRKTIAVKIEAPLARKADAIARDQGLALSAYLSNVLRAHVERDWSRLMKGLADDEGGGE